MTGEEPTRTGPAPGLAELLGEAVACGVHPSSPTQAQLLERLDGLRQRLAAERFQLAVLGQFKRGKSTLLNALLGADVLPTGVIPVTAIPTFFQVGPTPRLRVTFTASNVEIFDAEGPAALRERLTTLVSEDSNPRNTLGIARVEGFLPSELLARGVVLIDTPGVGSTFAHNTAAADAVLPECDAALFVVSPDPPITAVEIRFLERVRHHVARLIVVLNKIDLLEPGELATATGFLRRVLTEQAGLDAATPVFCVSARRSLRATLAGDAAGREASGLDALATYLTHFLADEKRGVLHAAIARKAAALLDEWLLEIELVTQALRLPLADLARRLTAFDEATRQFETQRRTAADLLAGGRRRALEALETDAERLRVQGRTFLETTLDQALVCGADAEAVRIALAEIIPPFFDRTSGELVGEVKSRLAAMLGKHQRDADELIGSVRQTAATLLEVPYRAPAGGEAYEARHSPFWVKGVRPELLDVFPAGVLDRLLPASARRARLQRRLREEIETVVRRNVENLRWATRQNLEDAFRHFGSELDERLSQTLAATRGAMAAALARRHYHSEHIAAEIERAETTSARLREIGTMLAQIGAAQPASSR
jgi:predicted GTPase